MTTRDVYFAIESTTARLCRLMPARFVLGVRSRLGTTVPLDYRLPIQIVADSPMEFGTSRMSCAKQPEMPPWIEGFKRGDVL